MYRSWVNECKLNHDIILLACKQCARRKASTFEHLDSLLRQWAKEGLTTLSDVQEYLSRRRSMDNEIKAVLERAGEIREITQSDRMLYQQWTEDWNMPFEVILLAAEYSVLSKDKIRFLHKILSEWHAKGINTVKEGKADHERHQMAHDIMSQTQDKGLKKQLDFNKFPQHSYTDEELESLYETFEKKESGV